LIFFCGGSFPNLSFSKIGSSFLFRRFLFKFAQVSKIGFEFLGQVLVSKRFYFAKPVFHGLRFVRSSQAFKIGYIFSAKISASLVRAFSPGLFFLTKSLFSKVNFCKGLGHANFQWQSLACKKLPCV